MILSAKYAPRGCSFCDWDELRAFAGRQQVKAHSQYLPGHMERLVAATVAGKLIVVNSVLLCLLRDDRGIHYVDDFNSFPHDVRRYFTGANISTNGKITTSGCPSKLYFVPFQMCITRICDHAVKGSKVHFLFGLDRPFAGYATALFKEIEQSELRLPEFGLDWKEKLGTASFPLAKETPQLQAADFLANLTYHHALNSGDAIETTPPSPILAKCVKNARNRNGDFFFLNKACPSWLTCLCLTFQ